MVVEFINKDYEIEPFYNVGAGDLISIDFDYRNCTIEEYARRIRRYFGVSG